MPAAPKTRRPAGRRSQSVPAAPLKLEALVQRLGQAEAALEELTATRQALVGMLEAASSYARGLMEAFPLPLLAIGADGQITAVNEATVRLTGLAREKLLGSDFAGYFSPPDKARAAFQEACRQGRVSGLPLTIRQAAGTLSEVLLNAHVHRDENQRISGVFAALRDAAHRKQQAELVRVNAQLSKNVEQLQQRESGIQRINKLYEMLQTCNWQKEAYPIISSVAAELFPNASGALAVTVGPDHELETVAEWGSDPLMLPGFFLDDCWALRRGQTREVHQPGTPLECRHFRAAPQTAYVCLPLAVRGELQGLLNLRAAPGQVLQDQQRHLLTTLGEVVKLSLSNLKLREVLRAQAVQDPLTGLFNRHYLDDALRRELSRAARRQTPLCLAMLDIDGFKAFNDTHGHDAGDAVLRALGRLFQTRLRASDIACRYGGDEFLLLLLDTDIPQVVARLEQLCAEIKHMEYSYEGSLLPRLSVSMGLAQWPTHAASLEELIKAADRALYAAKAAGRDRIAVYGGNAGEPQIAPPPAAPQLPPPESA